MKWFHRTQGPRPNMQRRSTPPARRDRLGRARRVGRVLVWGIAAILGGWTAVQAYTAARPLVAGWFEIHTVAVTGISAVSREEVLDRLQLEPRATLLSVSPVQLADRLESHSWIREVTVSRLPFHTLAVHVTERRAAAVLRAASSTLLLDEDGHVLTVLTDRDHLDLPVLVGIDPNRLLLEEPQPRVTAQNGIKLAGLLAQSLDGKPEVDMSDPDHAVAYVKGLRFQFGSSPLEEQWDRYRTVEPVRRASAGGRRDDKQQDVDLRYPGKVIMRERG